MALLLATSACGDDPVDLKSSCGISSKSVNFGTVLVGTSAERTITITASGSGAISGDVQVSPGGSCGEFAIVEGAGSYNLAPGQSRTVTVEFAPLSRGNRNCALSLGGSVCDDVALVGRGDTVSVCDIDRQAVDFGTIFAGDKPTESFTITNQGGDTLRGNVAVSTEVACDGFTIMSGAGPYSLTAGQSHEVTVEFDPLTGGNKSCRIETGNDTTCGDVELTGYRYPGWVLKDNVHWGEEPPIGAAGNCYCDPWLYDIVYSTSTTLFAVGYEDYWNVCNSECGYLLVSWDGGASWENWLTFMGGSLWGSELYGLAMVRPGDGVAVGDHGRVVTFYDDGANWISLLERDSGTSNALRAIAMVGQQGIAVGYQTIILTSNYGVTWSPSPHTIDNTLYRIDMIDANTAVALGSGFTVLRTTDGGLSWTPVSLATSVGLSDVDFASASKGWIVGSEGKIFRTTDGGVNWSPIGTLITQNLRGVSFADEDNGVVAGDNGAIWRTFDGGDTWREEVTPVPGARLMAVELFNAEVGAICGFGGTILRLE